MESQRAPLLHGESLGLVALDSVRPLASRLCSCARRGALPRRAHCYRRVCLSAFARAMLRRPAPYDIRSMDAGGVPRAEIGRPRGGVPEEAQVQLPRRRGVARPAQPSPAARRHPRLPRRAAERALGRRPHRVPPSGRRGEGLPERGGRLPRRAAGGVGRRHVPGLRAGERVARARLRRALPGREADHPLQPRLALPLAGLSLHMRARRPRPQHVMEGHELRQRPRPGVLRPAQAGVLLRRRLVRGDRRGVHGRARRVAGVVQGRQDLGGAGVDDPERVPAVTRLCAVRCTRNRPQSL